MRTRFPTWLALPAAIIALSGCQLITSLDENQITSSTSTGTSMSASTATGGGAGGMGGGTGSTTTASTSSQGGAGGAACMDPVKDCPPSGTACIEPICDGPMCGTTDASKDTPCTDAGGHFCDGAGKCVECNDAMTQCPDPMNECVLATCALGLCGTMNVDDLTPTSAPTQTDGDCKLMVCDGMGGTKPVDDDDPLDDGKTCTVDTCTNGANTPQAATPGTTCADDGGKVCGSGTKASTCVECLQDSDCTGGLVCDEANDNFKCVSPTCFDNTKDGTETDKDCGGALCSPCANGLICVGASDCTSAFCNAGICAACTTDTNCLASEFCDTAAGQCKPDKADGGSCTTTSQCTSGNCVDSFCCDTTCNSGCEACSAAVKGSGLDGACGPVANNSDPDNDCTATAQSTCGSTDVCDGAGACKLYSNTTICNAQACSNGVQSNTDFCSGTGTCTDAGTVNCSPYTCNGGGTACLTSCASDAECISGDFCNAANQCVPKQINGTTCGGANACTSGNCTDGVCCNSACGTDCFACNVAGSIGNCTPVGSGLTDGTCTGTNSCNGSGTCEKNDGQACALGAECLSGSCVDSVCCNTSCTGSCQACSAAKKGTGANGTCGFIMVGTDPDAECSGAFVCDGSGVCESCGDTIQNGDETDTDCGGSCGTCMNGDSCLVNGDCQSNLCAGNVCTPTGCGNNVKDGAETDIDCGGGVCPACAPPGACQLAADCTEHVCTGNVCQTASCFDTVKNGSETDADCGGSCALDCAIGGGCSSGADCQTGVCTGNVCQAPTCIDNVKNGAETDLDCGGPICMDCGPGQVCLGGGDCTSNVCTGNICQTASCMDTVKNGTETDTDCGGTCPTDCAVGQSCNAGFDCVTGVCTGNVCQAASCMDSVKNGAETGTDCGGGTCPTCGAGQGCNLGADCTSGVCTGNICQAAVCGDGFLQAGEQCDDANVAGNDGCSSKCKIESPYTCVGAGPNSCTSPKEINCNDGKDNDGDAQIDGADSDCALQVNASVGACGAGETALVYTSTDVPKSIPDNTPAGINSIVTVGGLGIVKRAVMQINITHTWDSDVSETLTSPSGLAVDATSGNGSSGDNYTDTILHTACATNVTAGVAPFTGCFKPEVAFTGYNNTRATGTWTLNSKDTATGDLGTLNSWRLALCVSPTNCGDSVVDAGETCDDGNNVNGDGCDNNCTTTACGNGVLTAGEVCDDGNSVNGDGCDNNCKVTACGNGVPTAGEACDDGNAVNGDGCDNNCTLTGCGNGVVTMGEQCEDGNSVNGDGCASNCQWENLVAEVEPNGTFLEADTALPVINGNANITGSVVNPEKDIFKFHVSSATVVRFEVFDSTGVDCAAALAATTLKLFDTSAVQLKQDSPTGGGGNASGINNCPALAAYLTPADYYIQLEKTAAGTNPYFLQIRFITDAGAEVEPNDTIAQATPLPGVSMFILGSHQTVTDTDTYAITVPQGASVRVETIEGNAETCESLDVDSTVNLVNSAGTVLGAGDGDDGRGYCSTIDGTGATSRDSFAHNLPAGTYYIRVTSFSTAVNSANQFDYRLVVNIRTP